MTVKTRVALWKTAWLGKGCATSAPEGNMKYLLPQFHTMLHFVGLCQILSLQIDTSTFMCKYKYIDVTDK